MWRACRAVVDLLTAKVIVPFPFFSFRLLPSSDFLLPEGACLESKRSGWQSIKISNFPRWQILFYRFAFSILLSCLRACEGFIKFICAHQLSPAWQWSFCPLFWLWRWPKSPSRRVMPMTVPEPWQVLEPGKCLMRLPAWGIAPASCLSRSRRQPRKSSVHLISEPYALVAQYV